MITIKTLSQEFSLQADEHILKYVHKHWFVLVRQIFATLLLAFIAPLLLLMLAGPMITVTALTIEIIVFIFALWFMIAWIALANEWTDYFLDMWIITNRRVIYIEQVRLFVREVRTLPLDRMQDVSVRYGNFLETILDFGTLRVQSAGAIQNDIVMYGTPHPNEIRRLMLQETVGQNGSET
jgi:hypothetical protein